jgi:hypothetical protein
MTLSPVVTTGPQLLRVQTSTTVKLIKTWGLPQA